MATLRPGKYNPLKPDIELFDFKTKKRFGLKLEGQGALQVGTISQDDSVHIRSAGKRIGDFDEQRSWKGGRGVENLSDNAEGFWDSMNAWTLTTGHLYPTLLWQFARGLHDADFNMPTSIDPDESTSVFWTPLLEDSRYVSVSFSSMGLSAAYARIWLRRVGRPAPITLSLHADNAGIPGTELQSKSITIQDVTDFVSILQLFDWTGSEALAASTTYHIKVAGHSTNKKSNHWEVGGNIEGTTGKKSTNGTDWEVANFDLYFYIGAADTDRTFYSFFIDSAMYLVTKPDNVEGSSVIYLNGDRGQATSATATTITHTGKTWAANKWAKARIKIVRGKGAGQTALLTSNTSDTLTFPSMVVAPNSTSEYIIYDTPWFTQITGASLGRVLSQPVVANHIVYFPQGESTDIRWMLWDETTNLHKFGNDGTNKADFLLVTSDTNGTYVYRARNKTAKADRTVSKATAVAYSATPAALTYGTEKIVGDSSYSITNLSEKDGLVYIFKEDGQWMWQSTTATSTLVKITSGVDKTPSFENGLAVTVHQQFMYYSWLHSLIRIYGSSHDDIGQDWSGHGLPDSREGVFASLDSITSLLIGAVDAGTGTSSVQAYDGIAWHELLRAYDSGKRMRFVKVQPIEDGRNTLWTDVGGDLVWQKLPFKKGVPRLDNGCRYQHEAVIESSAIDMGTASALPKFIKELTVFAEHLGDGNQIYVDYQVDDDVHTNTWTEATTLLLSPESSAGLNLANIRKFAYRLRILSTNNRLPVDILGVVPNGYARTPYKMVWTLRCKADNIISRGRLVKPDILMRWLLDNARYPGRIEMLSQYELAHKFHVIIHPPRMFPYKPAQNGQSEESVFTIVLEEI